MRRVRLALAALALLSVSVLPGCPPGGLALGVALDRLTDQVNGLVHQAGVEIDVAIIRAGAELNTAIENARNAWREELDRSLDRVDDSIHSTYLELEALVGKLDDSVERTVRDVGDRAQVLANTLPFANRAPQIRRRTQFVVVGATRFGSGASQEALAAWPLVSADSATLAAPPPPAGWVFDPDSAQIVIESASGSWSSAWAEQTAGRLVARISATRSGTVRAHLEWTEVRTPRDTMVTLEGNFPDAGETAALPTLTVGEQTFTGSASDTTVEFAVPESAFGEPAALPVIHTTTVKIPYTRGVPRRERTATYSLYVTQLPPAPGTANLYTWQPVTITDRRARVTGSGSVDSNYGADDKPYSLPFTFYAPAEDLAQGYAIDPASVRLVEESSTGKWSSVPVSVSPGAINYVVTALNCHWIKVDCPDGKVRFHVEYDMVKTAVGFSPVAVQRRIPLEWGQHQDVRVEGRWELRFTDMEGVQHTISSSNYTADRFVTITLAPGTLTFEVRRVGELR